MNTVTDLAIGFAIYIAAEVAINIKNRTEKGIEGGPVTVDEWVDFVRPQIGPVFEDMENDHPILLLDDEGELNPDGITPLMRSLVEAAMEGKVRGIVGLIQQWWRYFGDSDVEVGALIDREFLLTFHQRMSSAKNAFYHTSDWFTAAIDVDDDIKELLV